MNYLLDLRKILGARPLIACGSGVAIINANKEVLMQRRTDNNCWGFVGGMMELGETVEETARREAFEEVGIKLQDLQFFRVFSGPEVYHKYPNGDEVYNVINMFIAEGDFPNIEIDHDEVQEARFFAFDALPENINPPDVIIAKELQKLYLTERYGEI